MKQFFIEGLVRKKSNNRKASEVEAVSLSVWARNPEEAVAEAASMLGAVEWLEGPRLRPHSEEQRMRKMGAPELPGLDMPVKKKPGKRKA